MRNNTERDTSVSGLVKRDSQQLATEETDTERWKRREREIRNGITAFRAGDSLTRDELHGRSK